MCCALANAGSLRESRQVKFYSQSFFIAPQPLRCLLPDPPVDVGARESPRPTYLECRNFLGSCEPVDGPFCDLQEVGNLLDGEDLALAGIGRHSDGQFLSNFDRIVQNFQDNNDKWLNWPEFSKACDLHDEQDESLLMVQGSAYMQTTVVADINGRLGLTA